MAFDFNGKKKSPPTYDSPFGGGAAGSGSSVGKSPFEKASSDYSPPHRDSGANGFSNVPKKKKTDKNGNFVWNAENWGDISSIPFDKKNKKFRPSKHMAVPMISFRIVLLLVLAAVVILLCVVFQEEITSFLARVLTWVLLIALIVVILKSIFHRPKRRW